MIQSRLRCSYRRRQASSLAKRRTEWVAMQDRLLNACLAGTIEEGVYKATANELKAEALKNDEALSQLGDVDPAHGEAAIALFDWTQNAAEMWLRSNNTIRREILDLV